ncbi:MAG: TetR/AcrR family transcriptional regulator [Parvibaculum sp.]|nr:TetR/AcrR family transcriptional regulator [Parvibaculum sp.]|tara:strand:+ start:44749 stop:45330 length:582 start_codon:yes stop_codon:yes gene_type:complete
MPRGPNTKTKIERAALELFVAQGIMETRTRQIAEAVNISEGTIYRHFEGKDELARELFKRQHVSLAEAIEAAARAHTDINDQVRAIVDAYCAMADKDWLLFRYHQLSQHALLRYFSSDLPNPVTVVIEVVKAAMVRGELRSGDADLHAAMALGVVLQAVTFKSFGRLDGPLSAHKNIFTAAILAVLHSSPAKS